MMRRIKTVHLPEDLLVEILSRVPAKSLARLRSTSTRWNALVKDGLLAKKHSANAPRDSSLVLMVTDFRVHLASVDLHGNVSPSAKVTCQFSLQVDVRNAYHCDGLLVCITKDDRLVVWNPCTGETKWIQSRNRCTETDHFALGYDNNSSCYKILRIHRGRNVIPNSTDHEFEVYDFASNSWRGFGSITNWYIPRTRSRGISVKGTVYWLAVNHFVLFLLSFNFSTERFQSLSLPADAPNSSWSRVALSVARGEQELCMLDVNYGSKQVKSDVWIATKMEDTGAVTWSKSRRFLLRSEMRVLHDHENKVLLCYKCNSGEHSHNILQIVGDEKYLHLDHHPQESKCPHFLTYVPSLVKLQQGI